MSCSLEIFYLAVLGLKPLLSTRDLLLVVCGLSSCMVWAPDSVGLSSCAPS